MFGDNVGSQTYSAAMMAGEPHIILTIDTKQPIELSSFVGAFASLGNEYERYIKSTNPDLTGDGQIFVREVRAGSIQADLIPWLSIAAPFIGDLEKALIVEQFVRIWGKRFQALLGKGREKAPETRAELKDWSDAVRAIATDPEASATLEAATFEGDKKKVRAAFKFTTDDARKALTVIETRQLEIEKTEHSDHERMLMRFTRSDIGDVNVGKRSGERVVIEDISEKPLALIYGTELTEKRIKHEIRDGHENVFKKGFVVDVNVRSSLGQPVAYAVTKLHQVIDLD